MEQFTRGGVKQFYLTPQLCRVHKTIIFSRFIFPLFSLVLSTFALHLKRYLFLFFFIDLSIILNTFLFPCWFFPLFSSSPIPSGFFPSLLLPPVPSFHPKRKGFFLVNLSSWDKKKITPLIAPLHTPSKIRGYVGIPPSHFFSFFSGLPNPFEFFPLFPWWHYFHGLYFVNPKSPVCACDVGISLSNSHSLDNSA